MTWNPNGSLGTLQVTNTIPSTADTQTCSYGHDDLARIAGVNCVNGSTNKWNQQFTYDAFGNITKNSSGPGGVFQPTYSSSTNWMTALPGVTPTYDANGRLTYDGTHTYTWDVEGKLYTVDSTTLTHDALGRMVEKLVSGTYTQIVYGPLANRFAVMSGQTLQRAYIPLPAAQAVYTSSGLIYYRHRDHLGSSRLATTPSRTLYSSTAYAPYGESYAQAGTTDLSFTGQEQDTVSGIYDFMFRKYNPVHGRWLSPDPSGLNAVDPANPQTWNRYAYVLNNPMSLVDPLGLECVWDDGSYDAEDDPDTGSPAQCAAQGGNWIELGANGAWNPDPGSADPTNAVATLPGETVTDYANDPGMPCNPGTACYLMFGHYSDDYRWLKMFYTEQAINLIGQFKSGGCFSEFATEAFGPGGLPGNTKDEVIKTSSQAAAKVGAVVYAASKGLTVPMRSSIVRGILEGGKVVGEVAAIGLQDVEEAVAFKNEMKSWYNGECQ